MGGEARQVRDGQAGGPRPRQGERSDVAALVDDHERAGCHLGEQLVQVLLGVGDALVGDNFPEPCDAAGPVCRLADVQAQYGRAGERFWDHGDILPIVGRSERCFLRHPHYLAVARSLVGGSGSFLSVVGNSDARVGNTPRALEGQG